MCSGTTSKDKGGARRGAGAQVLCPNTALEDWVDQVCRNWCVELRLHSPHLCTQEFPDPCGLRCFSAKASGAWAAFCSFLKAASPGTVCPP